VLTVGIGAALVVGVIKFISDFRNARHAGADRPVEPWERYDPDEAADA